MHIYTIHTCLYAYIHAYIHAYMSQITRTCAIMPHVWLSTYTYKDRQSYRKTDRHSDGHSDKKTRTPDEQNLGMHQNIWTRIRM